MLIELLIELTDTLCFVPGFAQAMGKGMDG